jgi:chemotaxis protein methyltransferase CheR
MCKIQANLGNIDRALDLCGRLIEKDKVDADSYFLYATILQEAGRIQDALVELNKVLYLDHSYALAHFMLGNIYRSMGQNNTANKHLLNAAAFLMKLPEEQILEKSEGLTAGRLVEFIKTILKGEGIEI